MFPTRSTVFEAFVNPARARTEIWRTIIGALLIVAIWVASLMLVMGGIFAATYAWSPEQSNRLLEALVGQETSTSTAFFLSTYLGLITGVAITVVFLHKRGLTSLFGPSRRILWRHYFIGLLAVGMLTASTGILSVIAMPPVPSLTLPTWLSWLPLAVILLFFQTGAEELFFRGYLMQQLAARFESRWMWWVFPSVLFGAMHFNPALFGSNAWIVVVAATLMGLILADVTARSGSLSLAMGMHFANNFSAIALIGLPGQLSGLSLYHSTLDMSDITAVRTGLVMQIGLLVVFYVIYLLFFARRVPHDVAKTREIERVFS